MELGYGKLQRNNINTLQYAVHPELGLVWGDGQALLLTPLSNVGSQVICGDPVTLRKHEKVKTVAWSAEVSTGCRHLAVSTGQVVSVWLVKGTETTSLTSEQVAHLDISPLPQGLLWHPSEPILCILARDKIVATLDQHSSSRPVVLDMSNRGHVCTGVWVTGDDPCLLVAVKKKTSIDFMVFNKWGKGTKPNIADATVITMESSVNIRSMTSVGNNLVAMTTDLPLETLCCQGDMFDTSDGIFEPIHNSDTEDKTDSVDELSAVSTGPVDLTALCATRRHPPAPPLLFRQLPKPAVKETAELVLFRVDSTDVRELSRVGLSRIITPDLIAANPRCGHITVGSNTADTLQVFSLQEGTRLKTLQEIILTDGEKAKGIHMPDQGCVVAMVGKRMEQDFAALLSTSTQEMYQLRLRCFELKDLQETSQKEEKVELYQLRLPNGGVFPTLLTAGLGRHQSEAQTNTSPNPRQSHLLQDVTKPSQQTVGNEEPLLGARRNTCYESCTSDCSGDLPSHNVATSLKSMQHFSKGNKEVITTEHQSVTDLKLLPSLKDTLRTVESLEREMKQQVEKITQVKENLIAYSRIHTRDAQQYPEYPSLENAQVVHIAYEDLELSDEKVVKMFLLDRGMLKLGVVQEVFGLRTVEMCCKEGFVVVSANKDGYIPLRLAAGSFITIRGEKNQS
ncbi:WD repeat and coiled-coil-containing protein-like [Branchiostoma floridae x Branchiostoma belcheri]